MISLQVAFFHVLFNVVGVAMMWKVQRLPIAIAERFARLTQWNRLLPLVYIMIVFYLLPFLIIWFGR